MSQARKRCPICDAANPHKAAFCNNCGASLSDVEVEIGGAPGTSARASAYDFRYGETDLAEDGLRGKARTFLLGGVLTILIAAGIFGIFVVYPAVRPAPTFTPTLDEAVAVEATRTARPTILLATVTRGSPTLTPTETPSQTPTATLTFTPEPCTVQVQPQEGMISLVSRCGHRHLDVIPMVVTMNSLNNENDLRSGQTIIIPHPTQTENPNPTAAPTGDTSSGGETAAGSDTAAEGADVSMVSMGGGLTEDQIRETQVVNPFFRPTSTNPPGIQNYTVMRGDTIISVIAMFNTNINAMDMLNPDLTFSQCEMGQVFGGNTCSVAISEGQVLRVPAPTPTPTLSPTPNGSETPTPTATATYNAPSPISPTSRAYFRRDAAVTLRWAATGMLAPDEVYLVTVQDLTRGQVFISQTTDLFYRLPMEWQGENAQQYEYAWSISIAKAGNPDSAVYTTSPLTFTWEGRGENS